MGCSTDSIMEDLLNLIHEELRIVSYKWLARHYNIPSNQAKQILYRFTQQEGDKLKVVYLVSGYLQADSASHVVRLVDASQLTECRSEFATLTSTHVHSVMPAERQPVTDPARLCAEDLVQARQLYHGIVKQQSLLDGSADVLARNACSSVMFNPLIQLQQPDTNQQQAQELQVLQLQHDSIAAGKEQQAQAVGVAAMDTDQQLAHSVLDAQTPSKRRKGSTGKAAINPATCEEVFEDGWSPESNSKGSAAAAAEVAGVSKASGEAAADGSSKGVAAVLETTVAAAGSGKGRGGAGSGGRAGSGKQGGRAANKGSGKAQKDIKSFFSKR